MSIDTTLESLHETRAKVTLSLVNGLEISGNVTYHGDGMTTLLHDGYQTYVRTKHISSVQSHTKSVF